MINRSLDQFSRQVIGVMPLILREFMKREDNPLSRGRISFPQMVALDYLSQKHRVKMTDLAGMLSIKLSSATALADRLIRARMLTRARGQEDRRLVWLSITSKGRKVVAQIKRQKRESIQEIFGALSAQERRQYLAILFKVGRRLAERQTGVREAVP